MKRPWVRLSGGLLVLCGLMLVMPGAASGWESVECDDVPDSDCTSEYAEGSSITRCSAIEDNGAPFAWLEVGAIVFGCDSVADCADAQKDASEFCFGHSIGCLSKCGGGCCDGTGGECCNGGCLTPGQTCCGEGACDAGWECSDDIACIPEDVMDCGDGLYCEVGNCCGGGCIDFGVTCCNGGACGGDDDCIEGLCVPRNGVTCEDGTICPADTACASGQCCPTSYGRYDSKTGYCCGTGPEAGVCTCVVTCDSKCCPEGTMCCDGLYCAPTADACPKCPADAPKFCPDHTCVPNGATCCGEGYYCENSLTCMGCDHGVKCCGTQGNPAENAKLPENTGSTVPFLPVSLAVPSTNGTPAEAPAIDAEQGKVPGSVHKAGGCNIGGASSSWPGMLLIMFVLLTGAFVARRLRV